MSNKTIKTASGQALFWFPMAVLLNAFSMTALLVILGFSGYHELASNIGLVQGATLATFYVFSANARNLILAHGGELAASRLLHMRLVLLLPLVGIAYFLSVVIGGVAASLALVLILRRVSEWIGEIWISQHERLNQLIFVQRVVCGEVAGFLLCLVLSMGFSVNLTISAIPWALTPLISVFRAGFSLRTNSSFAIHNLVPHIGSSAIIGISVYVFRISVTLLVGKVVAGELFTAFAIGGVIPTIFGQALAPTLMRFYGVAVRRSGWFVAFQTTMLAVAGGVVMLVIAEPVWLVDFVGRSSEFRLAMGLSITGGAIMIIAVLLRAQLIHNDDDEVFGPDMMANVLLLASVTLAYYILGAKSLVCLYLLSACLNLVYILGAVWGKHIDVRFLHRVLFTLGLLLVMPVFFQFEGNIFRDPVMFFLANGQLSKVPIPVSLLAVFGGIAILGNYKVAKRSLTVVFSTLLIFLVSTLHMDGGGLQNSSKIMLISQFLLPIFGLVLGEMFGAHVHEPVFERAALSALLMVLPTQLAATWLAGHTHARPLVFIYSIYQHLQYFPVIVAALTIMASYSLWNRSESMRIAIGFMIPIAILHLVASKSINAIVEAVTGLAAYMVIYWRDARFRWHLSVSLATALLMAAAYASLVNADFMAEVSNESWSVSATDGSSRVELWRFFADGITASPKVFLFGHATRPDYDLYPSAHNYWLDVTYSFGIFSVLPLVVLLSMTIRLVWKQRRRVMSDPVLLGTTIAAGYLVLVESMFNIGMRQLYPGILSFFILGLLISRLGSEKTNPIQE